MDFEPYELYHDESKEAGYWHGMLLVPVRHKSKLLENLVLAREHHRYKSALSIKKLKPGKSRLVSLAECWVNLGVWSLIQSTKGQRYPVYLGKKEKAQKYYHQLDDKVGAKFIVFRDCNRHTELENYSDYGAKIETSFRIGLKGGLHFLGDEQNKILVDRIHFDGYEHYQRHVSRERIVNRMNGLRSYCQINSIPDIIDDRCSDHQKKDSQLYEDCQLLQLTDLLVGSFRIILTRYQESVIKQVLRPSKMLIDEYKKGYARMKNSRWFGGYCISQCELKNGEWSFSTIDYEPPQSDQLSMF